MKTGNVNAKEKNWRWTLRRGIASLLAAVECFSVVAVGAPASYAEWPEETPTAVEEAMSPQGVDVEGENGQKRSAGTGEMDLNGLNEDGTGEPDYLNYYDGVVSVYGEVPAGTEIGVFDVYADFEGFDPAYYDALAGTLTDEREEDGLYWQRTVERDYTLLTAQNIALSVNGESIQPEPGSPLEISISDPAISEERNLQLWHVDDYGYAERVTDFWVDGSSIRFMAESVSSYLVLQVMSRTTITVSDGETYQITVSYDQDAGLPEITDLSAWELYDTDLDDIRCNRLHDATGRILKSLSCVLAILESIDDSITDLISPTLDIDAIKLACDVSCEVGQLALNFPEFVLCLLDL